MKFKRIISSLFLFLSITLSSCSLFGGADEGLMIERVESTMGENGSTLVTMYFTDEDVEPLTFEIPRGETGEIGPIGATGLGIKEITSRQSEDGLNTILTIVFTSEDVPNQEITVPNGVSVADVTLRYYPDEETYTFEFTMSNGDVFETETFEKPKDGIGISSVDQTTDNEGNIIITITYTDSSMGENGQTVITIPYKNGEDGRGIESIVGTQVGTQYTITIFYTDGVSETLPPIQLPNATKWLYGQGEPTSRYEAQANEGDYYFDLENRVIYIFTNGYFNKIIDLTEDVDPTRTYHVTFDANGGEFVPGAITEIDVTAGRPIAIARIPECFKTGFVFNGYYTTPEGPDNPLSGKLTDLTPIYQDITFYAHYIEG